MDYLVANNIYKKYANHTALRDVSINVPKQSIYGLLGPNGAGKTTFLRIINQIIGPDEGTVFINGEKLNPNHISIIGYLPEERGLYKKMKVGEQALYLARLKGLSQKEALEKLKYWFEKFDIIQWWDKKVEELSKGMQQKIQFIVTILHNPKLLIFDEPFSGFDPINVNIITEEILNLRNNGATIIFSTHIMSSVESLCDNMALINNSQKILEGKVSDIKNQNKQGIFNIHIDGKFENLSEINEVFTIKGNYFDGNKTILNVKANKEITANEAIKYWINNANICSFNEVLPSIHDIFVNKIKEKNS